MQQAVPVETIELFPKIDEKLISLLKSLSPADWNRSTIARQWTIKDIASHLLDGNMRTLSLSRDGHTIAPGQPIQSYQHLLGYLDGLNHDWVTATKRLSPGMLIFLLEATGKQYCGYLATLDPFAEAIFPVAWAGEERSANWFHIAREYTEKFIHQQQIRYALNDNGLMDKTLFYPFIDTFMYGLPHTFRDTYAENGTVVKVSVTTEIGGSWFLIKTGDAWKLAKGLLTGANVEVALSPDIAWKLFSKGISPDAAKGLVNITGDATLGSQVLKMVSVMA